MVTFPNGGAAQVFRDFDQDGNPVSGAKEPEKGSVRGLLTFYETLLNTLAAATGNPDAIAAILAAFANKADKGTDVATGARAYTAGAAIASASTIDLGAATGDMVFVTGAATITSLGVAANGMKRTVIFTGVNTLTHNGGTLVLNANGANITTAAGDVASFRSHGSGSWRCVSYTRANGAPLAADPTATVLATAATGIEKQGRTVATVAGSGAGAGTYVMAKTFRSPGTITRLRMRGGSAGGTAYARIFGQSGGNRVRIGSDIPLTIAASSDNDLAVSIPVLAGQSFAIYAPAGNVFDYTFNTADDLGWYAPGGNSTSFAPGAINTFTRLEIGIEIAGYTVNDNWRQEADASVASLASVLTAIEKYGRQTTPVDGTNAVAGTYVFKKKFATDGRITRIRIRGGSAASGTIYARIFADSGSTRVRVGVDVPLAVVAATDNDFAVNIPVLAGQSFGLYVPTANSWKYSTATADDDGWYQAGGGSVTTFTPGTVNTATRLEVGIEVTGYSINGNWRQSVEDRLSSPLALSSGLVTALAIKSSVLVPPYFVVDGNSLPAGALATVKWPDLLGSTTTAPSVGFGVNGQTTPQMTADAVAQIDPYVATAVALGCKPVLLPEEIYNDIRVNSISVVVGVDHMETYCAARRNAGFIIGLVNLAPMAPNGGFTSGMHIAVNNELDKRWFGFADFLVDLRRAPELLDNTNLTYFNADGVHWTDAGQAVCAREVRRCYREWLLRQ